MAVSFRLPLSLSPQRRADASPALQLKNAVMTVFIAMVAAMYLHMKMPHAPHSTQHAVLLSQLAWLLVVFCERLIVLTPASGVFTAKATLRAYHPLVKWAA